MKSKIFKWIDEKDYIKDPILWAITEDFVQGEAEQEIHRKLTQIELNRFREEILDGEETFWRYIELIRETLCSAVNNTDNRWEAVDEWFRKEKNKKK